MVDYVEGYQQEKVK